MNEENEITYVTDSDDPFYKTPGEDGEGEREYVLLDEGRKRTKKAKVVEEPLQPEENHTKCYSEWSAYYQPIFEANPYSLGHQEPDAEGNYTWSAAMDSANRMVLLF